MSRHDWESGAPVDRKSSDGVRTHQSWRHRQNERFSSILELFEKVTRSYSSRSVSIDGRTARRGPYTSILSNAYRYSTSGTLLEGFFHDFLKFSKSSNSVPPLHQQSRTCLKQPESVVCDARNIARRTMIINNASKSTWIKIPTISEHFWSERVHQNPDDLRALYGLRAFRERSDGKVLPHSIFHYGSSLHITMITFDRLNQSKIFLKNPLLKNAIVISELTDRLL